MSSSHADIASTNGPLLVLLPGLGAVSTTFIAGVELARRGLATPVGSMTQLGRMEQQDGVVTGEKVPWAEALPLASLDDLVFAAWDIHGEDALTVARRSEVLNDGHLREIAGFLSEIEPMPGVHDPARVQSLEPVSVCPLTHRRQQADQLRRDIREALARTGAVRAVALFLASTERRHAQTLAHQSLQAFEAALDRDDAAISPTQLYAYAALQEGVPFANGTPNSATDTPALRELALLRRVPTAGRDLKTGQTLLKTVIAPGLRARMLGVNGWFSTNILGNRDGAVLDDREAFASKESTKKGVLDSILKKDDQPALYGHIDHVVNINYYPPRGDQKEGWDNIDLFGWLGYQMQVKVNFLCRDSILAAPLVLDIALLLDLAHRAGEAGVQQWLGFFFKAPATLVADGLPEHDLFVQKRVLDETLARWARQWASQGQRLPEAVPQRERVVVPA
jgi:myo-inositol-1-phosphate synthase